MSHLQRMIVVAALMLSTAAYGQQTIINVPSDAQTPAGKSFFLHESQLAPNSEQATFATTNFYTYGITDDTEFAATLYGVDNAASEFSALGVGFKSGNDVLHEQFPEIAAKWTYGFMMPVSLIDAQSRPAVGYFPYTHVTFEVPETKWRLLAGVAAGSKNLFGEDAISALGGAEYPITEHLSFTGEWFSGNHNLSGLIPGFTYHRDELILVGGYKIPNDFEMKESALVLEIGIFFGGSASHDPNSVRHYGIRPN